VARPAFIARVDARWLARVGAVPKCPTGRLPVDFDRLLAGTGYDSNFGQSPAAFAAGRNFETACAGPNGSFAALLKALRDAGIDPGNGGIELYPDGIVDTTRATRTRRRIRRMLDGDTTVVLLAQAALLFPFANIRALIRPDAVVIVPAGGKLWIVELKGFRMRVGHYPAQKIADALEQSAVYQIALRRIVASLGFDPALVADQVVIVCAARRGMEPIATVHENGDRVGTLELRLARAERALVAAGTNVLDAIEALNADAAPDDRLGAFEALVNTHGNAYSPECLNRCGGAVWCRESAIDDPARLGSTRLIAAAGSIRTAHGWASGTETPDPGSAHVAERLAAVRALGELARADAASQKRKSA
jgi:hypothetical protein